MYPVIQRIVLPFLFDKDLEEFSIVFFKSTNIISSLQKKTENYKSIIENRDVLDIYVLKFDAGIFSAFLNFV